MVAEEVPPVTPSIPAGLIPRACCHRVGVKRSREQTNQLVACTVPVRPALDADPARPVRTPIMDNEERGAGLATNNSSCSTRSTACPPFLTRAALAGVTTTVDVDTEQPAPPRHAAPGTPTATHAPIHGLLSRRPAELRKILTSAE